MRTVASISDAKPRRMRSSSRLPHGRQLPVQLRAQLGLARLVRGLAEARAEQLDERAAAVFGMGAEHVVLVRGGERRRDDAAVAAVGAQDRDVVAAAVRRA